MKNILIIEDDKHLNKGLSISLEKNYGKKFYSYEELKETIEEYIEYYRRYERRYTSLFDWRNREIWEIMCFKTNQAHGQSSQAPPIIGQVK